MTDKLVNNIEEIPLSGDDLLAIAKCLNVTRVKWMLYDDLEKFKSVDELFGNEYDSVYILLQVKDPDTGTASVGHWVCFMYHRDFEEYYYFDPYGLTITEDLSLTHEPDFILQITKGVNVQENNIRHQVMRSDINTCGRHCVVRSVFFHLNNDLYNKLVIQPIVPIPIKTADVLVALFTGLASESDAHLIQFYNKKEKQ